ncbi:potassium channel family protein [Klebsiella pneumoniae]|nr:potassium channel family protein [Klebsiella pneumoniae]
MDELLLEYHIQYQHRPNSQNTCSHELRIVNSVSSLIVTATTVGYGDMLVTTAFGRIISIILAIYGILFLGSLSGLVVSYYTEVSKHYSLAIKQDKQKTGS